MIAMCIPLPIFGDYISLAPRMAVPGIPPRPSVTQYALNLIGAAL